MSEKSNNSINIKKDQNLNQNIDKNLNQNIDKNLNQNIDKNLNQNIDKNLNKNIDLNIDKNLNKNIDLNIDLNIDEHQIKLIKRANFDPEYYCSRYFMHNFKSSQDAYEHWEKEGYDKGYLISVCDELKSHDHCLCVCKIKENKKDNKDINKDINKDKDSELIDIIKADSLSSCNY